MTTVTQKITIKSVDPIKFAKDLLDWGSKGAKLVDNTFVFVNTHPMRADLEIEVDVFNQYESSPGVVAIPIQVPYTKEQLDDMDWDTLKKVCKAKGITGRDRALITSRYLQALEGEKQEG